MRNVARALALVLALVLAGAALLSCAAPAPAGPAPAQQAPAQQPAAAQPAAAQPGLKFAMILPGPISDADYNMLGYQTTQEIGKTYNIPTAYSEKVAVADAERVGREYVGEGYNVIAFHGGQFLTAAQNLAAQYPNVTFIIEASGQIPNTPPNVWVIGRKYAQGGYALGQLAGLMTKSNKIGFIAGTQLPDFVESINGVHDAIAKANPNAKLVYSFTGDQNDPVKARETAEAMIADGADFIIDYLNNGAAGVEEAVNAAKAPVYMTTFYTDKTQRSPERYTTSLLIDFTPAYKSILGKLKDGTKTGYYEMRPGSGFELMDVKLAPANVAQQVKDTFKAITDGSLKVEFDRTKLYDK